MIFIADIVSWANPRQDYVEQNTMDHPTHIGQVGYP